MKTLRILYHLALADFYERTRRFSFLLILAAAIAMGVLVNNGSLCVELAASDYNPRSPVFYRGELNSAWIGMMTTLVTNTFLGVIGFYLVSDCIKRDIRTGVGQIIATTPVSRAAYLVGKWISNFVVLSLLVLILAAAAVVMVLLKGEAATDLYALLMPFLAVALPNMALTAALAVFFETVPWLREAMGNVIYLFTWLFSYIALGKLGEVLAFIKDPVGQNLFSASLTATAHAAFPDKVFPGLSIGIPSPTVREYFNWPGLSWTPGVIGGQWFWAVFGLGLILLSTLWFARFDPSGEGLRRTRAKADKAKESQPSQLQKKSLRTGLPSLSPLFSYLAQASPFLGVLIAELRLLLNGRRWWWWLGMVVFNVAILSDLPAGIKPYLAFAWLWPLAFWSGMGNRERKENTAQMVFSSARPVLRQLPAAWLAGVLATALLEIAWAVVSHSNGDLPSLAGWIGAVIFIPTLALSLGVFSSGNRVFEVVYVIWWYMGTLSKTPGMDFTAGAPQFYLLAAAGLLLLAAFWRGRQVRV